MEIKRKKKITKSRIMLLCVVALLLIGAGVFYIYSITRPHDTQAGTHSPLEDRTLNGINNSPPTDEQINGGGSAKKDLADESESATPTPTSSLSIDLTAFRKSDGSVHVAANIQNRVLSSGNCSLIVTKGDSSKTYQSEVAAVTNYSTCKGFDIPGLDPGTWQIQVKVTSDTYSGDATTSVKV